VVGDYAKNFFNPEQNYDEFYGGHKFEPFPENLALVADEVMPRVGWALDVAREIDAKNLLDLGCLDGFCALTLAAKLGIDTVGIDLSREGIRIAKERAEKYELPARFQTMEIEDYESPVQFDLISLFEVIEHFKEPAKVVEVCKRQLRHGGVLLVSTPDAEGDFGITNTEDICHLQVYTHRDEVEDIPIGLLQRAIKPTISLPEYLRNHGFTVESVDVWNELIHVRATI
jgi:2-polyprenyl-3-methyl-5-hydroxy-6-metoxy-1,4-benzoquinol methylase